MLFLIYIAIMVLTVIIVGGVLAVVLGGIFNDDEAGSSIAATIIGLAAFVYFLILVVKDNPLSIAVG